MGKNNGGRIRQQDWRCNRKQCRLKADGVTEHWNFERVDQCYLCKGCRPHNATIFAKTPAGKAALAGGDGGGGGGTGGGGGGGGGGGKAKTALDAELDALKAENKKLSQQLSSNDAKKTADKKEELRRLKEEKAKLQQQQQQLSTTAAAAVDDEGPDSMDAECLDIDIKHAEKDQRNAAQTLKERPLGVRGHEKAVKDHEEAKQHTEDLKQQKRDSKDPYEQLSKKSHRIVKLQDSNKSLCSQLATKLEEQEAAAEEATKLAERIRTNKQEIADLEASAAALTAARSEQAAPDLASVAQTTYSELIGKFSNPLFSSDATIAAKKIEMEGVYKILSDTFQEMATFNALLDAAAEKAATLAATSAAETKPPEDVAALEADPTGILAITTSLRPTTAAGSRDTPYAARTVIARPTRTPQSASTDPGNSAAAAVVQPAAKTKPPRDRSEAELLDSVNKLHRATPASDMDQ
jgi:hypothetical protein